jgi:hypothetical protein
VPKGGDDEVARLKAALARAEGEIKEMKVLNGMGKGPGDGHDLHARSLGPSMMPGNLNALHHPAPRI